MAEFNIRIEKDNRAGRKKPYLVRWPGEFNPHTGKQKRYSRSFAKRKGAERFLEQKKDEFEAGLSKDIRHITLKQLCDKFITVNQKDYTDGTLENYQQTIERLLTYFHPTTPLQHIKQEHAQEFIAKLDYVRKEYKGKNLEISDSTRNIQLRNCNKIFNTAKQWKYIIFNPFEELKQVKAVKQSWHRITVSEFKDLMDYAPNLRVKTFYSVMYGLGLRSGEALNLLSVGRNIDFDSNQIHLFSRPGNKEVPPFTLKDKEARSISMPNWVKVLLEELYKELDPDCPFIFLTPDRWQVVQKKWTTLREQGKGRKWKNSMLMNNLHRDFVKCCSKAGIKTSDRLCIHCLRKSWACNLAENGIAPKTLCELGGWSKPETLHEYYTKVSDANRDKARRVLDELMGE